MLANRCHSREMRGHKLEEEDGWSSSERDWVTGRQSVLGQPASPSAAAASPARQPKLQVAQAHGIVVEKAKLWQVVESWGGGERRFVFRWGGGS